MTWLGWAIVAIPGVPFAVFVLREVASEVRFAIFMSCHDRPPLMWDPPHALTSASLPPARGLVVEGELVEPGDR